MSFSKLVAVLMLLSSCAATAPKRDVAAEPQDGAPSSLSRWADGRYTYKCTRSTAHPFSPTEGGRVNPFTSKTVNEVTPLPHDSQAVLRVKDIFVHPTVVFEMDRITIQHLSKEQKVDFRANGVLPMSRGIDKSQVVYDLDYSRLFIDSPDWTSDMGETPPTVTMIVSLLKDPAGAKSVALKVNWEEPEDDDDYIMMNYDCELAEHAAVPGEQKPSSLSALFQNRLATVLPDGKYSGVTHGKNGFAEDPNPDGECTLDIHTETSRQSVTMNLNETGKAPVTANLSYPFGAEPLEFTSRSSGQKNQRLLETQIRFDEGGPFLT